MRKPKLTPEQNEEMNRKIKEYFDNTHPSLPEGMLKWVMSEPLAREYLKKLGLWPEDNS